ncbi:nucleotidyltransferase family protein [Candidatus Gracilibacteria bacterium]|nr:nucleotidyltransferase family protein [Candidatus Gracilibacteria bacterium]
MKAIILAAGYATRLYPLTLDTPKPLLPMGKKVILDFVLEKLKELPLINEVFVVTNNKFASQFEAWARTKHSFHLTVVNDGTTSNENRLGSLGDIRYVIQKYELDEDLLVIAGDNVFDFSLKPVSQIFDQTKSPTVLLYDVGSKDLAKLYGVVSVDFHQKITRFEEKPANPASTYISTAIYFYPQSVLTTFLEFTKTHGTDRAGDFLAWLSSHEDTYGILAEGKWFDIGDREQLEAAREVFGK